MSDRKGFNKNGNSTNDANVPEREYPFFFWVKQ